LRQMPRRYQRHLCCVDDLAIAIDLPPASILYSVSSLQLPLNGKP
jgi:hypothetical protein